VAAVAAKMWRPGQPKQLWRLMNHGSGAGSWLSMWHRQQPLGNMERCAGSVIDRSFGFGSFVSSALASLALQRWQR